MADDTLRMSAVVVDGFSGPLKTLQSMLGQVGNHPAGKSMQKDWAGVSTSIQKVTSELRTGLSPVLSNIGVGSLGLGTALAGATLAMKNFAFSTRDMSMFGRQVGLSTAQLKEMKAVGERFGLGWDQAQGSLKTFAGNLDQVQRRWGEAYGKLRAMNLGDLAENLVSAPNMQAAIDKSLDALKGIQNPVRRREVAELLFGSDQWAVIARELTETQRKAIRSMVSEITPEMEKASSAFVENWFKMEKGVERFTTKAIGPLLPQVVQLMDLLGKPIGDELTASLTKIQNALSGFGGVIADFKSGNYLSGLRKLDSITDMGVGLRKAPDALDLGMRRSMVEDKLKDAEARGDQTGAFALRRELHDLTEEIRRLRNGGASVQQQSYSGGGGMGGLIQTAGFGGMGLLRVPSLGGGGGFGGGGGGSGQGSSVAPPSGSTQASSGGSRAWRNNNPGNISAGGWANSHGAVGSDGRFAIFPDYGSGRKAQEELLFNSKGYRGLTVAQAMRRWAPAGDGGNNPGAYAGRLASAAGVSPDTPLSVLSPEQRSRLLDAQQQQEGWKAGRSQGGGSAPAGVTDLSGSANYRGGSLQSVEGFIVHHTGGGGTPQDVIKTLNSRGLGVQYVMGRDGKVYQTLPNGARGAHIRPSQINGLSNANTLGMEVIAKDDKDVTPQQVDAAKRFIAGMAKRFPGMQIFGHGEVNPGHKQADEGLTIANAIRSKGNVVDPNYKPSVPSMWERTLGGYMGRDAPGDRMMGRAFGAGGIGANASASPKMEASGSVQITLQGGLEKMPARVSMDGLFKDVQVNRGKQMEKAD